MGEYSERSPPSGLGVRRGGHFAVRYNPEIERDYQRKSARSNRVVVIKTVAHKLARVCYYILRDRVTFDVNKAVD